MTSNAPLRSGKGSCYEGGLRVPLLVRWPGVTPAGGVCPEPVVLTDLFPTLLGAAGVALPDDAPCDGVDLRPVLGNPKARLDRAALFFHYPHYYETTTPVSALRAREWKLVEYAEDGHAELYRLTDDPVESRDLAQSEPGTVAELRTKLGAWKQSVGAREARPNPGYGARP